jgi:hypothetical protein
VNSVVIINSCSAVHDDEAEAVGRVLLKQMNNHVAPAFGLAGWSGVTVAKEAGPHEWPMLLLDRPDQPGALGDHDETADGLPIMRVFPLLDAEDGVPWSGTASHEGIEATVNRHLRRAAQRPDGTWEALEPGDRTEQDLYGVDDVMVSNFILPAGFEPPKNGRGPFDFMGLLNDPFEIRPGGYVSIWDGIAWTEQVNGEKRKARQAMATHGRSRHLRRVALAGR